jgi:hypothetical protein
MVNINLKIDHTEEKREISPITGGIILGAVLVLLLIAYGGILLYRSSLNKKIAAANLDYSSKVETFKAGKAKNVFDFQNRLNNLISLNAEKEQTMEALENIEKSIVSDAYIDTLEYDKDKGEIKMLLSARNYNGMARQLLSFKKSGYYSDIEVKGSEFKEGRVSFPITLTIK